jgi:hypothetical protein
MKDEYGLDDSEILSWAEEMHLLPAVKLLMNAFDGAYFTAGYPWMMTTGEEEGRCWVDFEAIPENLDMIENESARGVVLLAASLSDCDIKADLSGALVELDEDTVKLVLAAIADHAANYSTTHILPVYPWPRHADA